MTNGIARKRKMCVIAILAGIVMSWPAVGRAQQPPAAPAVQGQEEELAKKLSNPISDLVSVPLQFNWAQNVGPNESTRFILNVQPVMPFSLNQSKCAAAGVRPEPL